MFDRIVRSALGLMLLLTAIGLAAPVIRPALDSTRSILGEHFEGFPTDRVPQSLLVVLAILFVIGLLSRGREWRDHSHPQAFRQRQSRRLREGRSVRRPAEDVPIHRRRKRRYPDPPLPFR